MLIGGNSRLGTLAVTSGPSAVLRMVFGTRRMLRLRLGLVGGSRVARVKGVAEIPLSSVHWAYLKTYKNHPHPGRPPLPQTHLRGSDLV